MASTTDIQHAALWMIGPDMPGLLNLAARFVAQRGGNIEKDIASKFGEKAMVFLSITASPPDIARMDQDKRTLQETSGCGVVFQPMAEPIVPDGFLDDVYGFEVLTDDAPGLGAKFTSLLAQFGVLIVSHTGERRVIPGLTPLVQVAQRYVVMLPRDGDRAGFARMLEDLVNSHNGIMVTPLGPSLWSW